MSQPDKMTGVMQEWRRHPIKFVMEIIGARPTNQQSEALRVLGSLYEAKMKMAMRQEMTDGEKALAGKIGISIRSGHGTGKDAFLAWVYLWLLTCFPGARGLVTAPTQHQLQDILWAEMRRWSKKSVGKLHEHIEVGAEKAFARERDADAFVVNRTARATGSVEEQAETLSGMHGDYLIIGVDEASGCVDGIFRPLEGAMTGKFNIAIMISNPTRNTGYFFNSHHTDRRNWITLHWPCEESDMDEVTGVRAMASYVERMASKYGRDSNFYRMRVTGDFPMAEPDALIALDLILSAVDRPVVEDPRQGLVVGVDVAWLGDDLSVLCPRRGMIVDPLLTYRGLELMALAGYIVQYIAEERPKAVMIDSAGVGAGVVSRLREMRKDIQALNVSESAARKDRFQRLRDELWWRVRERFESRLIRIPNDDELIGELASIKWKVESNGRVKIESKSDMRKRGLPSPNRADALMMTEYHPDSVYREAVSDRYGLLEEPKRRGGWMTG